MNRRTLYGIAGLTVIALLVWYFMGRNSPEKPGAPVVTAGPSGAGTPSPGAQPGAKAKTGPSVRPSAVKTSVQEKDGKASVVVRVKPDQVLGSVNETEITFKDLAPLPADREGMEQVMSAEHFEFLLNRALDRELTYQTARTQGVELSEEQKQQLAVHKASSSTPEAGVFDTLQRGPVNTEFQQRDLAAMALQYSLAEKAGVPPPHVTSEAVSAYYQKHSAEYPALPTEPAGYETAWAVIDGDIRAKLAPEMQKRHEEAFTKYLEQLRATARVTAAKIE